MFLSEGHICFSNWVLNRVGAAVVSGLLSLGKEPLFMKEPEQGQLGLHYSQWTAPKVEPLSHELGLGDRRDHHWNPCSKSPLCYIPGNSMFSNPLPHMILS